MGVCAACEVGRRDFLGCKCHGGTEISAHGALAGGRHKRAALAVFGFADFEACSIAA